MCIRDSNERVDVIQWDEDPAVYVSNALSPAKVNRVIIDEENNYATIIVPDYQLSLAIGKEGQNARCLLYTSTMAGSIWSMHA